jgi:hypothetical protein
MLTSLHGHTPAACEFGEVLPPVAMQGDAAAEASPDPTDLLKGLRPGPFVEGLLADGEQDRAAASVLSTHDMHAPLVLGVGTAAARHAIVDHDLAVKIVLGLDNAPKEHPAVHAGVGCFLSRWVRWWCARLFGVHSL